MCFVKLRVVMAGSAALGMSLGRSCAPKQKTVPYGASANDLDERDAPGEINTDVLCYDASKDI